jgi:hypothetical protein
LRYRKRGAPRSARSGINSRASFVPGRNLPAIQLMRGNYIPRGKPKMASLPVIP